jgi:hypothetical protein
VSPSGIINPNIYSTAGTEQTSSLKIDTKAAKALRVYSRERRRRGSIDNIQLFTG